MRLEPIANPSTARRLGLPALALLATLAVAMLLALVAGANPMNTLGQIATGVDARDLGDLPLQGVGAATAGGQRNLAFRRQAAHQDSDMEGVQGRTHGDIRRLAHPYALNTVNRLETIRGRGRKFVTLFLLPLREKVARQGRMRGVGAMVEGWELRVERISDRARSHPSSVRLRLPPSPDRKSVV